MTGPDMAAPDAVDAAAAVAGASRMSGAAAACIDDAARYLASQPDAVHRALGRHQADATGRCTGCGSSPGRWPCATAASARRALDLITVDVPAPPGFERSDLAR